MSAQLPSICLARFNPPPLTYGRNVRTWIHPSRGARASSQCKKLARRGGHCCSRGWMRSLSHSIWRRIPSKTAYLPAPAATCCHHVGYISQGSYSCMKGFCWASSQFWMGSTCSDVFRLINSISALATKSSIWWHSPLDVPLALYQPSHNPPLRVDELADNESPIWASVKFTRAWKHHHSNPDLDVGIRG